ncbi:MAG: DUF6531 domain-containing protein [Vulcanimicrobiaceae bacterium]
MPSPWASSPRAPRRPNPSPIAAVVQVTVIPVARAAAIVRELFPHVRVRTDGHANALVVVGSPEDVQSVRTVVSGVDVKNPTQPVVQVIQLHVLKPQEVVEKVGPLFPNASVRTASKTSVLVRATALDSSQIQALISSLDVPPASAAPSTPSPGRIGEGALARFHTRVLPQPGIPKAGPPMPARPHAPSGIAAMGAALRRTPTRRAKTLSTTLVQVGSTPSTTGINRYWRYEEGAIPGIGKDMLNVGTGNLVVQSDDLDVPERGIDLAFRRTYNSTLFVQRDWNAAGTSDDGAPTPGMYGQGWTNTFDAHLAQNSAGGISVFDIDGARYDYTPGTGGCYTPPAGMHATLCSDGGYGYYWQKKSGTLYHFYTSDVTQLPAGEAAYAGRLYMIFGRNYTNWIRLTYEWANSDSSTSANLRTIAVSHADGQQLLLNFAPNPNDPSVTLLMSITRPGESTPAIFYTYDSANDLQTVTLPSNGSANSTYDYGYAGPGLLAWAASPRWTTGSWGSEGGYVNFIYTSGGQLTTVYQEGIANFAPGDGTGTVLQPSLPTGNQNISSTFYQYGSSQTQMTDTDGHATTWQYDSLGRVTQTQAWTGAPNNLWLTTLASWDTNDNLIASTDARGNETDYGYDANGNTRWVQQPQVATNVGTIRPTARYAYDQFNNLVAYCDPSYVAQTGVTTCSATSGATYYTYDYSDSAEPYGKLASSTTPMGYQTTYTYDTYGMPLTATGVGIVQADGTTLTPTQTFTYNPTGTLASYSKGGGIWRLTYDGLNRQTSVIDPDPGSPTSCTWYNSDGTVSSTEGPTQQAVVPGSGQCNPLGTPGTYASSNTYDADGNVLTATVYRGTKNEIATTQNWYDGSDRLIEVQEPYESALTPGMVPFQAGNENDFYPYPWRTRYLYDLSQGGTQIFNGTVFAAHGNLFETQSYLGSSTSTPNTAPHWEPIHGQAFDTLDRLADKMTTAVCPNQYSSGIGPVLCASTVEHTISTYDGNGEYGLLTEIENADGSSLTNAAYDNDGHLTSQTQASAANPGAMPYRTYLYDADGRPTSIQNAVGTQTWQYDQDGRVQQTTEPTTLQNYATISYGYYPNGLRSSMQLAPSGASAYTQSYDYGPDLALKAQTFAGDGQNYAFAWSYTSAGRLLAFSAPGQSQTFTYDGYGRVSGLTFPGAAGSPISNTAYTYDAAGEKLGYSQNGANPTTRFDYNLRGELVGSFNVPGVAMPTIQQSANGHLVGTSGTLEAGGNYDSDWDARSGALLGPDPRVDTNNQTYMSVFSNGSASYDVRGDLAGTTQTGTVRWTNTGGGACSATETIATPYSYDVENHTTGHGNNTMLAVNQTGLLCLESAPRPQEFGESYAWGPNGHPVELTDTYTGGPVNDMNGRTNYEYVHWDGASVAYTSFNDVPPPGYTAVPAGIDRVFIGNFAVYYPSSYPGGSALVVTPRDETGMALQSNGGPFNPACHTNLVGVPIDVVVCQPRLDGYSMGITTIQGVRSYDPGSAQWTTPDAYAGDIHDPMSQQPYMWNNNNPMQYSDPSGYVTAEVFSSNETTRRA